VGTLALGRDLANLVGFYICRVGFVGPTGHLSAKKFRDQNEGQRVLLGRWHVAADLRDADEHLALADTDRVVDADVGVKTNVDLGNRTFRIERIERVLVEFANRIRTVRQVDVKKG